MPTPSLAILSRIQKSVHNLRCGFRRFIGQKRMQFLTSWRKADQVESNSSQPLVLLSRRLRYQMVTLMLMGNKCVDGVSDPARVGDCRDKRTNWRLKCPMKSRIAFWPFVVRRRCTLLQPGGDSCDLFGRKWFTFWRHPTSRVAGSNPLRQHPVRLPWL